MSSINKGIIIGNIGSIDIISETVVKISVATTESYKKDDEWINDTEWHSLVLFGRLAERADSLSKGDLIYAEGRMKTNKYEKDDGTTGYSFQIKAQKITKLSRSSGTSNETSNEDSSEASIQDTSTEDDIPF